MFTPPSGHTPLRGLLPGQCLLLVDHLLMWMDDRMWLDNLYVRLASPRYNEFGGFVTGGNASELWMTGVTLQGNGDGVQDCDDCALFSTGLLYAYGAVVGTPCAACAHQASEIE